MGIAALHPSYGLLTNEHRDRMHRCEKSKSLLSYANVGKILQNYAAIFGTRSSFFQQFRFATSTRILGQLRAPFAQKKPLVEQPHQYQSRAEALRFA